MSYQNFKPWAPLENLPERMASEGVYYDAWGLRIFLNENIASNDPPCRWLRVAFDEIKAYRVIDEGAFIETFRLLDESIGFSLFYVSNKTEFMEWFQRESYQDAESIGVSEYLILTTEKCISVLSIIPPKLSWVSHKPILPE